MSQVGDETMIHDRAAELSRANVMRLRGNFAQARTVCHTILTAYPDDVETYCLLAEICIDEGDLDTAAHWYDIAQDKDPGNNTIQVRAQMLRTRITDGNTRQISQQMQAMRVPVVQQSQTKAYAIAGGLGVVVIGTLLGLFLLKPKNQEPVSQSVNRPVKITRPTTPVNRQVSASLPSSPPITSPPANSEKTDPFDYALPPTEPEPGGIAEDEQALAFFEGKCADGSRLLSVQQQPSNKELNITFQADPKDDLPFLASRLAVDMFRNTTKAPKLNFRAILDRNVVFACEVSRQDYDEAKKSGLLDEANPDPDVLLKNIWVRKPDEN